MAVTGAADGSTLVNAAGDTPLNTIAGIANEVQNNGFSLVLMNGDLAYADGYLCKPRPCSILYTPFTLVQSPLSTLVLMNGDLSYADGYLCKFLCLISHTPLP